MKILIAIEIKLRPGIFVPKPQELFLEIRRRVQTHIVGVQRWSNIKSLTALNATVHEMVTIGMEVVPDAAPTKAR